MSDANKYELEKVKEFARRFDFEDVGDYMTMVEYADWMTELMDDPEAEMFSSADLVRINMILIDIFEDAHDKKFDYGTKNYYIYG